MSRQDEPSTTAGGSSGVLKVIAPQQDWRTTMKTLTAVLLSAVGIACAAPAYADDAQFLQRVSGLHGDRGALIALAHDYCAALPLPSVGWGGPSPLWQAMQPIRSRLGALGNDPTSEVFAFAAEDSYCPGADQLRQH